MAGLPFLIIHGSASWLEHVPWKLSYQGQIEPAAGGAGVSDVRESRRVRRGRCQLPVQDVGRDRQEVIAVGGVDKFSFPDGLQAMLTHPRTDTVPTCRQPIVARHLTAAPTAVAVTGSGKGGLQMNR